VRQSGYNTRLSCLKVAILGMTLAFGGAITPVHAESKQPVTFSLAEVSPYAFEDDDGDYAGLLVDLIHKLRDRTGLPIEYRVRPHARTALELKEGTVDFAPYFDSPVANSAGEPIADVVEVQNLVVGLPDHSPIESLSDLEGENVGYLSGTWYGTSFQSYDGFNKVEVHNVRHGVRLMREGRLSAVVASDVAISDRYSPDEEGNGLRKLMVLGTGQGKIYKSRESERTDAVPAIQSAMSEMVEDGTLEALFDDRYESARETE